MLMRITTLLTSCAILAACSGAGYGDSTTPSSSPSPTTTGPPTLDALEIAQATIAIETPDWTASGFDAVWIHQDTAEVARIDPADDSVETIRLEEGLCQGIGVGLGSVWTCETDHIVRIDPETLRSSPVDVQRTPGSGRFPEAAGRMWVLTGLDGDQVSGIDRTGRVVTTIDLPGSCSELSEDGLEDSFFVACADEGTVHEVDAASEQIVTTFEDLPGAIQVVPSPDAIWVGYEGGIAKLDPSDGTVRSTITPGPGESGALDLEGDTLWSRSGAPTLTGYDTETDAVTVVVESPIPSGGDVEVADGSIWVTFYDGNIVYRLPADI